MLPFALRRPWLLLRDLWVNRDEPDLEKLRATHSPERFLWAILPHAARTFSACIAMLPAQMARAAAVGYLYCRILDTYEDLAPSEAEGQRLLLTFAKRFGHSPGKLSSAPSLEGATPVDHRDRAHLLLVDCCDRVDAIYHTLPKTSQRAVQKLVRDMAGGMIWARRIFEKQRGCLHSEQQLYHYCHAVLGNPVAFAQKLILGRELSHAERSNAMRVGEFVQLANVTRDIEKDLARRVAYDSRLAPYLGHTLPRDLLDDTENDFPPRKAVHAARIRMFAIALDRSPAYTEMLRQLRFRRISLTRASAMLMFEFCNRYYRSCAQHLGRTEWPGPRGSLRTLMSALPSLLSQKHAMRRAETIKSHLLAASPNADNR
ncbi:MAG: squalene/phytoene synthase family protein [Planctomycetes bacterium]|nr:squalene/phytoene synthase family protein [Planctomycetota bacterium]